MNGCFIDTLRPTTTAEKAALQFYLEQPQHLWKALRSAFRGVHDGVTPGDTLLHFVASAACTDAEMLARLENALQGLAGQVNSLGISSLKDLAFNRIVPGLGNRKKSRWHPNGWSMS